MSKRPKRKARLVDIDRLLEEDGTADLWEDLEIVCERPETKENEKKEGEEESTIILTEK
jgi:hypothetical protein